ncbi:BglG family transcription antiterminator [Caminicella sporogenes]|uniref:BglG family transcription antiterminator n=1 Tax=Caminicella sporogenes TaxID=166485 RepID=UPI002541301C|nr:BglG family transcription antiterminator [Caminicella sporogenes]WIF95215.1 BglG family transcription antiterminator [Caminicella sporogenes]
MKFIFNKRLLIILQEFINRPSGYLTSSYLSKIIGVTSRTVRSDLKDLDEILLPYGARIYSKKGIGYKLEIINDVKFSNFSKTLFNEENSEQGLVPSLPEERVQYIIKKLLEINDCITLEELCDELYISTSTIKKDLKKVKSILQDYRLVVVSRLNKGIRIEGKEIDKRFCMAEYFLNRSKLDRIDLAEFYIENIIVFKDVNLKRIEEVLIEELLKSKFPLADIALKNLIIHIAIAIKRIKEGNYIDQKSERVEKLEGKQEYYIAKGIVKALEKDFEITIPSSEVYYVTIHLLGSKLLDERREVELTQFIEKDIKNLIVKILMEINRKLNLDFSDDKGLICGLALHLKPTFHRLHFNMNLRNPWLDEVKTKYPLAFQAGVIAAQIIEKETGYSINESEIGYLAMHFGGSLERKKRGIDIKKRIAIICSSGMGSSSLLLAKLKNSLNENVDLIGTFPLHQLDLVVSLRPDIILTTVPIKEDIPIPKILVNAVLEDSDLDEIKSKIKNIDYCKNDEINFEDLFVPDLFFTDIKFESKEKVLDFLTSNMVDKGYIDKSIKQSILAREKLSSTAIGNLVAIPHALEVVEVPSCVCIGILNKPIVWDKDKKVQLIMILSISKNISDRFNDLFSSLYQVTKSPLSVVELIKQKDFDRFYIKFLSEKEKN